MQYEQLEHQWDGTETMPEWVADLLNDMTAWYCVGPRARDGELGLYTGKYPGDIAFVNIGDWIIADIDGTFSVETDEQHER
jgi:hypothetical protein